MASAQAIPKVSKTNLTPDGKKLLLQYTSRLILTDEQRTALKAAFFDRLEQATKPSNNSGISVVTHIGSDVERQLGMDKLTFSSLVSSRESINIPVLLRMQRVLGVELVTKEYMQQCFKEYLDHLISNYW